MPTFTHSLHVSAAYDRLWALVRDVRRVAGLFSYLDVEDVEDVPMGTGTPTPSGPVPIGCAWTLTRSLTLPGLPRLRWRERTWVLGEGTLAFAADGGDLQRFDGTWQVEPDGIGAALTFTVEYEIPTVPGAGTMASGPAGAYLMGELFKNICRHVAEEAEGES